MRIAVVILGYVTKTKNPFKIGLWSSGHQYTHLFDDAGNTYELSSSSGISDSSDAQYWLTVEPGARATASFIFRASQKSDKKGARFTFTSGQKIKDNGDKVSSFNISIRDIEPR